MFTYTLMLAICSTGFLFYQIGSQLIANAPQLEKWSAWRFGILGLVAIACSAMLTQFPQFYEDGSPAPPFSFVKAATLFGALALLALLHGFGIIRLITLLIHGREAAYADLRAPENAHQDFIDQHHGPEAEAYRMRRLTEYEKHISSNEKRPE